MMPTEDSRPNAGAKGSAARANVFVAIVTAAALVLTYFVWRQEPGIPSGSIRAVALLTTLALMGEAWQFLLPSSGSASISFIPYAAMALVVPHWVVLAAVALAKIADGSFGRRVFVKALFNVVQFVVMFACTIIAYKSLGGTPFLGASLVRRRCRC